MYRPASFLTIFRKLNTTPYTSLASSSNASPALASPLSLACSPSLFPFSPLCATTIPVPLNRSHGGGGWLARSRAEEAEDAVGGRYTLGRVEGPARGTLPLYDA